jgi:branched-chain amino acid transport system permease protein
VTTLVLAAAAALAVVPLVLSEFYVRLVAEMLVMGLFAAAFNLLLGYGGMLSFGHAGYYAVGAYTLAILTVRYKVPFAVAFLAAPVITAAVATVTGYFCVRLRTFYFAVLTLAFGQLIWGVIFKWTAMTGGDNGIVGIDAPRMLRSLEGAYYFVLVVTAVCLALQWAVIRSPFGRVLVAVRENDERAQFMGVAVNRLRLFAFVVSAAFSGVAGALFAQLNGSVFPTFAFWTKSGEVIMMAILGGTQAFLGPLVGSFIMLALDQFFSVYTEYWPLVLGTTLLVLVLFLPKGLVGVRSLWRRPAASRPT